MMMMSVCVICGDKGRIKELICCVQCKSQVSVVHRYCKPSQVDEIAGWTCDDCLEQNLMKLREASMKSSRIKDRWIKKSNYKTIIHKPNKEEIRGSGLDSFQSKAQMEIQSVKGSLEDTSDHPQYLEQRRKACFRCGLAANSMDLIDCGQCHNIFVHSQCKSETGGPDWTCGHCMEKKSVQIIDHPEQFKQTSRMRAGWIPWKQLSDKHLKLGFHDKIFRKESNHRNATNEVIKVLSPNVHSTSVPHNGTQVENRHIRKLVMDCSDIFGDEDYTATKVTQGFQNAQYRHWQVEPGNHTSSDKNRGSESDHGTTSSKVINTRAANLLSTSVPHDGNLVEDDSRVGHAAAKAKRRLSQVVRDWPQKLGPRNDTSSDKKRSPIEQPVELKDRSNMGARHDVPSKPIINPLWQGHVLIQLGSYKTVMELFCCQSTNSSSKVAEAIRGLPRTINFAFKCRPVVWPRRFQKVPLSNEAIDVFFLPKKKDVAAYDEMLDRLVKYELALLYEMPFKNQKLLIFPSWLLPLESRSLQEKYYMWATLEERGR